MDKSAFQFQRGDIQGQLDLINDDLDKKQNLIKTIESFIDRYQPVRILHIMREGITSFLSRKQILAYENYERQKLKKIHD